MLMVEVIGSTRLSAGIPSTVRRLVEALRGADVLVGPRSDEPSRLLVADPAAWYAARPTPPTASELRRTIGFSLAPYGSPTMQDDAALGRELAAICHPEAPAVKHLRRLGCRAHHVPLGCRAGRPAHAARDVAVATSGATTQRRLRVLAGGAPSFDDVRCVHRFDEALAPGEDDLLLPATRVFLDIAAEDDPAPDPVVLLDALEAGAAVATERLGDWPGSIGALLLRAPIETLFARARELAREPRLAAEASAGAHAALAAEFPLGAMGNALAEMLAETDAAPLPASGTTRPRLSHHASPPERLTVAEVLERERQRPDAALREGLRMLRTDVSRLHRRLARVEQGSARDATEVVLGAREGPPPHVSVLVPTYGGRRTVREGLESVRASATEAAAPALEIVVVDDGSPDDDTGEAVAWARTHPELAVTVLRHRYNRGLAAARNTALEHARGEYVLPLDADNALRPGGLRRLLHAIGTQPAAAFAYGILEEFDARGPVGLRGLYPWDPRRLRRGNYIDALALIRCDVIRDLGGYATDMSDQGYEDWDLWCRFADARLEGAWVPEIVARYRVSATSMSAGLHLSQVGPLSDMLERHNARLG